MQKRIHFWGLITLLLVSTPFVYPQENVISQLGQEDSREITENLVEDILDLQKALDAKSEECVTLSEKITSAQNALGFTSGSTAQLYNSRVQSLNSQLSSCKNEKSLLDLKMTILKSQGTMIPRFNSKLQESLNLYLKNKVLAHNEAIYIKKKKGQDDWFIGQIALFEKEIVFKSNRSTKSNTSANFELRIPVEAIQTINTAFSFSMMSQQIKIIMDNGIEHYLSIQDENVDKNNAWVDMIWQQRQVQHVRAE